MIKWIKKLFTKEKNFDDFLKELVKERREAKYVKGTRDTGPIKKMDHHQMSYPY